MRGSGASSVRRSAPTNVLCDGSEAKFARPVLHTTQEWIDLEHAERFYAESLPERPKAQLSRSMLYPTSAGLRFHVDNAQDPDQALQRRRRKLLQSLEMSKSREH